MKITAPLLLLPLLLAACGTQSVTPAASTPTTATASVTDIAAFEAGVQRDLAALGLAGTLSAQAVEAKSYLNVLKVSDTTARAYMKTTYPAATGCALDWGDGTALSTITTPSVVATDKADHTYAQSGTYTIKLTCGADVKTSTFVAVVPQTDLELMEDYNVPLNSNYSWRSSGDSKYNYLGGNDYTTKGLVFNSISNYAVQGFGAPAGHKGIMMYVYNYGGQIYNAKIRSVNNKAFNLNSMTANAVFGRDITITAYSLEKTVIGADTFKTGNSEKHTLNWKNVSYIEVSTAVDMFEYINIDDMSITLLK